MISRIVMTLSMTRMGAFPAAYLTPTRASNARSALVSETFSSVCFKHHLRLFFRPGPRPRVEEPLFPPGAPPPERSAVAPVRPHAPQGGVTPEIGVKPRNTVPERGPKEVFAYRGFSVRAEKKCLSPSLQPWPVAVSHAKQLWQAGSAVDGDSWPAEVAGVQLRPRRSFACETLVLCPAAVATFPPACRMRN